MKFIQMIITKIYKYTFNTFKASQLFNSIDHTVQGSLKHTQILNKVIGQQQYH